MARVLLVVPPFHQVFIPAIGRQPAQGGATPASASPATCGTSTSAFAERSGPQLYTSIAAEGRFQALAGEWVFAGDLFGDARAGAPALPGGGPARPLRGRLRPGVRRPPRGAARRRAGVPGRGDGAGRLGPVRGRRRQLHLSAELRRPGLLRRLKARYPEIHTAMGGANCEGEMGAALHALFPFVDYVCSGEGDRVVPELVRRLLAGESPLGLPGIFARGEAAAAGRRDARADGARPGRSAVPGLRRLLRPVPASSLAAVETPTLALETSRGCWWGAKHHCTFCGLNGGTMQYRSKSPERAARRDRLPRRPLSVAQAATRSTTSWTSSTSTRCSRRWPSGRGRRGCSTRRRPT